LTLSNGGASVPKKERERSATLNSWRAQTLALSKTKIELRKD